MRVRAVTIGWTVEWREGKIANAAEIARVPERIRDHFAQVGIELQTVRLATQPFPAVVAPEEVTTFARALCAAAEAAGLDYVSMGPAGPEQLAWASSIVPALVENETLFAAVSVTTDDDRVALPAVEAAGRVISELARRTAGGFGNLRFAVLALCPPGIPFFPAAYHDGGEVALSVAWEVADEALAAVSGAPSLGEAERRLEDRLSQVAERLWTVVEGLAGLLGARPLGIDCSLAPYPDETRSVAAAFERLGLQPFGAPGTLAVAASITSVLQRLPVQRTGFCGLMLPVLEDARLGALAQAGQLQLSTLLVASAVCGVGLDVIPLPGETTAAQLSGLVLDVATLATRLKKPLLARLMPIPSLQPGEAVRFDFSFFAPAAVVPLAGATPQQWFTSEPGQNTGEDEL